MRRRFWILALVGILTPDRPQLFAGEEGSFRCFGRIPMKVAPVGITAGDFGGDGRLSLATVHGTSQVNILDPDPRNIGRSGIRPLAPVGQGSFHIRAVDLDGDALSDLAVLADAAAAVQFGNGAGGFTAPVILGSGDEKTFAGLAIAARRRRFPFPPSAPKDR